ncbi:MAG: metallophosphoesterase [Bryobacteraceae bacterium]
MVPSIVRAQPFHVYVGQIEPDSALIAWGTTAGPGNTIGRDSASHGHATVRIDGRSLAAPRNWLAIEGLAPDREYPYEVALGGRKIGEGRLRTVPRTASKLCFLVLGDWGNGKPPQFALGQQMTREVEKRSASDNPVRFVLTTGDNIYADTVLGIPRGGSGRRDEHWGGKFFLPYARLLARVPFYPSLGNHDGNESESREDLPVYLDNFFFPRNRPARYYRFGFGGLAEFFALDTTRNSLAGPTAPQYLEGGEQSAWLAKAIGEPAARWKIPYFHHPPFTAGPRHDPMLEPLAHWLKLFQSAGVKVVFTGHEHNLQFSEAGEATGGIRYVISGAGGELRRPNLEDRLEGTHIAAWAAQRHFLVVEIENAEMRITPIGVGGAPLELHGAERRLPLVIK